MNLRALFVAVPLLLVPSISVAQSITIANQASLPRLDVNGNPVQKRPLSLSPEGVNRRDCDDAQKIRFPVTLSGFQANGTLSAWSAPSGVDCGQLTNRNGLCTALDLSIPLQPSVVLDVPVRRLVASAEANPDDRGCGDVDFTTVDVQFLYFAPGDVGTPLAKASTALTIDTVGPVPPKELRIRSEYRRLLVAWDPLPGVTELSVYCDASPSSALRAGIVPTPQLDAKMRCARLAGAELDSARVSEKGDGTRLGGEPVVIAVAATDAFGNVGPLSEPITATPSTVPESSESLEGGGCATSPTRASAGGAFGILLVLLAAFARRHAKSATSRTV